MKHARADYNRIQYPSGLIPIDEPVFLLRGQDKTAWQAVENWAERAGCEGAHADIVAAALLQADAMREWAFQHGKLPDMPANPEPMAHVYRHKKRGTTYVIVGRGYLQSSDHIGEGTEMVAYRCREDGTTWFRPASEFNDGRFELVSA